jgi:ribosomal protein L16/L10AE
VSGTDPDRGDELEDLLQFVYQCPIGLIEIDDRAVVRRINPAAARMLAPALAAEDDLTALHGLLERLCPDVLTLITQQPSRMGSLHPGRRIVVQVAENDQGRIELRAVRVDRDRVMLTCSDVTEEQRLARSTLTLARRLRDVVAATAVYRSAAAQSLGVGTSSVMALEELLTRGPRTPGALARHLGLTPTTLTATIDQLERAGLAVRTPPSQRPPQPPDHHRPRRRGTDPSRARPAHRRGGPRG